MATVLETFRHWYLRAQSEPSDTNGDRFIFLYMCMNVIMAHASGTDVDAQMIDWMKKNPNVIKSMFEKLINAKNGIFSDSVVALQKITQEKPLESNKPNKPPITIDDPSNFGQVLDVIYRIRCNLIHGCNKPDDQRDLSLIKFGTEILLRLVGSNANWSP
jgi:hypothetical protein